MSDQFKDRRAHVRIYRNFILSYQLKESQGVVVDVSQVHNISLGGVCFVATSPIAVNTALLIKLSSPFLADALELEARVLESIEKVPGLLFDIRVQFMNVSDLAKEIITKIEAYSSKEI